MVKSGEKTNLRYGYTTGACASAAAGAAALALKEQADVDEIFIILPGGERVRFQIHSCAFSLEKAECSVIKDAGDDPDSTNGAEIRATVRYQEEPCISIRGGKGVGTVTKPGLEIPVGQPAINPVPLLMIDQAVRESITGRGVEVTISVTDGEELAKKTLNARIGILGGISIIGTSGIVVPYSIDAYQASISQALSIAAACGTTKIVISTGRRSEKYAQEEYPLPEEAFIQAGDFIGYSLSECAKHPIDEVIIWGMTGKMSKLAHGDMYTNISDSQIDFGFLRSVAETCGIPDDILDTCDASVTANQFRRLLPDNYADDFCVKLCNLASEQCSSYVNNKFTVTCVLSDYNGNILGRNNGA